MSYSNEQLERIIETSQALIDANNTNDAAQAALAEAQKAADSAQQDVDQLTALLDQLVSGESPAPQVGSYAKVRR